MNIQALLLDTIHYTAEGITLADVNVDDMPLIFVNDAFCRMTGYEAHDVLGKNCRFLQTPQTDAKVVDQISQCIRDRSIGVFEIENQRKDGTRFWNRLSLAPIYHEKELICYAGIQSDISVHKQALILMEDQHQSLMKMMGMVSGDMRQTLKTMIDEMEAGAAHFDQTKYLLHQLSLVVTMIETNSTDIMQFVKRYR